MTKVEVTFDGEEYRVPGQDRRSEDQAYYTNDQEDAIDTARAIHGEHVTVHFRRKVI